MFEDDFQGYYRGFEREIAKKPEYTERQQGLFFEAAKRYRNNEQYRKQ
jgi:hypothetical protein